MTKSLFKSKTFYFNVLALLIAVAGPFGFSDFEPSPVVAQIVLILVPLANVALRYVTKQPVRL